jgi:regulator of protease activity HflC (stomatin/prohibitin superfamily)
MFGIQYFKSGPTDYILHYVNGRLSRSGIAQAFFYYKPAATIVSVPIGSADVPFIFNELSADFQPLTVQGQLTYRIVEPERVAHLLDYTVTARPDQYVSDDPEKLAQRLVNLVQVLTRAEIQEMPLRSAIHASDAISLAVMGRVNQSEAVKALGVEILDVAIQSIKPIPEIARALEAEAREGLLRQADQAIYDRRNAAVEQERRIKENELNTEIAVEEKKRKFRETKVEADLAVEAKEQQVRETKQAGQIRLEEERKSLVSARVENARAEADAQAYAVKAALEPLKHLEPEILQLLALQSGDPRKMVSLALREIAQNAGKIGNLNISPDLLETLLQKE